MDYNIKVKYQAGKGSISDYTSRHPVLSREGEEKESRDTDEVAQYVNFIINNNIPKAITRSEIIENAAKDSTLQKIIKCKEQELKPYKNIFPKLTSVNGLILGGNRIVIPKGLQERTVEIAHQGYDGIVQTKQMLRAHVWFPGIDASVERML